ncbi:diheme cytochrome c [Paraburkholderia phenoliruptrix]
MDHFLKDRQMNIRFATAGAGAAAALCGALLSAPVFGEESQQASMGTPPLQYRQECAACHIAYPPGMLPAESWRRILNGLDHHFGTNASLDLASVKQLESWLVTHAARPAPAGRAAPKDRITGSTWFMAEHDEIPASTWRHPAVRSASNCAACHTRADQGNFDERTIRIPR